MAKIAVEDKDGDVRQAAVEKMENQAVLAKIAVKDNDIDIRRSAMERLIDQDDMLVLAAERNNKEWDFLMAVMERLRYKGDARKIK